jgi:hypothetical protein
MFDRPKWEFRVSWISLIGKQSALLALTLAVGLVIPPQRFGQDPLTVNNVEDDVIELTE